MKKLIIILFICVLTFNVYSQDSAINFDSGNWSSILTKAKEQDKLIFVDAYAVWCGPCKRMARDVFTDEEVGEYYNSKFVNVKMDMERGEGLEVASTYDVTAYPTLLFINGDGELVHKGLGGHEKAEFIQLGEAASDPASQLVALQTRYDEGDRDPIMLKNYTKASRNAGNKNYGQVALAYLETQDNWKQKENLEFILSFVNDVTSKPYKFLIENRRAFVNEFGQQNVDRSIGRIINNEIYNGDGGSLSLDKIDALYKEGLPEKADEMSAQFRVKYYERAGDGAKYAEATDNYLTNFPPSNWQVYNSVAWTYYENYDQKELLKRALGWAQKSVEMDSNYYNNDTLAALYYKLGKKRDGIKAAKTAIKIAKSNGETADETISLLKKIKKL